MAIGLKKRSTKMAFTKANYVMVQLLLVATACVAASPICCWSDWGTPAQCGDFPHGATGGRCNTDWAKHCNDRADCPANASTPAPSTPLPPPGPNTSAPSVPPGPRNGTVRGFWYGYVASAASAPAPPSGWFFSFPGDTVAPPFTPTAYGPILAAPTWGAYAQKLLTQGGGGSTWGDALYKTMTASIPAYKAAGWGGVCWDWEQTGADHTTAGFNALMNATKAAGLINVVTTTAEGPYSWQAPDKDARGIDWSLVDYFAPQMYGAAGTLPSGWRTYAEYWTAGANKPNIHGVTFGPIPLSKFLWAMPVGTCADAEGSYGGAGCVEWAYDPSNKPPQ